MAAISANMAIGSYLCTYGATSLGLVEGPYNMQMQTLATAIRSDYHGDMDLDYIDRGQNWFMTLIVKQWTAIVRRALFPFGDSGTDGELGQPGSDIASGTKIPAGRLYTGLAKQIVLTPVDNTPADAVATKLIYTAPYAILRPNSSINLQLGNVERNIPIEFQFLPNDNSGQIQHLVASNVT